MYGLALGSCLNMVLDPLFIYGFKLGVVGAAWATLIAITVSALLFSYWLFFQKNKRCAIRATTGRQIIVLRIKIVKRSRRLSEISDFRMSTPISDM